MLDAIKSFFQEHLEAPGEQANEEERLQLACAALLIEVAKADTQRDAVEIDTLRLLLQSRFKLSEMTLNELVRLAESESDSATSLYQFTKLINDAYSPAQKVLLLEWMWQVAYADGRIDKYEEHLIRRIADLLYLSHRQFIQAKLKAAPAS